MTIHRYRRKYLEFKKVKVRKTPNLTDSHISRRREWCSLNYLPRDYFRNTLFIDESKFEMNYENINVWVQKGEKVERKYFQKNEKLMVAGGICEEGKTFLEVWRICNLDSSLDVKVDSVKYKEYLDELDEYCQRNYNISNLQLDSARPHLKHAKRFLNSQDSSFTPFYQPANR